MGLPVHTLVNERILFNKLKAIFPDEDIQTNVKKETNVKYPSTGTYMEFDLWMPNRDLCFEFQDSYHYETTWYHHSSAEFIQQKDSIKNEKARANGLVLVEIPYWWDGNTSSIIPQSSCLPSLKIDKGLTFVQKLGGHYPFHQKRFAVFKGRPHDPSQSPSWIPQVGEIMSASFPVDENRLRKSVNNNWWMGEKYDGVRFCWNGKIGTLYSRNAKRLSLLPSIENQLPSLILDGELWFGRGRYNCTYTIFKESNNSYWPELRAITFDVPDASLHQMTYEERYQQLVHVPDNPVTIFAARILCCHGKHLAKALNDCIREGGEGVILQFVGSLYSGGRSPSLLKLKAVQADQEGIVVDIAADRSVLVKTPDGITTTVPAQDVKVSPLAIGEVVTFSYENEVRRSIPVRLKIERIRSDLSWDDVVASYRQERDSATHGARERFNSNPIRHWSHKSMRVFMENYAKNRNMDSLLADTWHTSSSHFLKSKEGKYITSKFKGGYFKAVQQLFPEVHLNSSSQHRLWEDIDDRRKYFEEFARNHGFDHNNPEYWYYHIHKLSSSAIQGLTAFHKGSLPQTLLDLFPDVAFKDSTLRKSLWKETEKRRQFFIDLAKAIGFDHMNAESWYSNWHTIWTIKGASGVALHHNHSISRALVDLFPDIALDISKLNQPWIDVGKRRRFFEAFASDNNFDPTDPEAWYLHWTKLWSLKRIRGVIFHHSNSVSKALIDLFPNIGLSKAKLTRYQWFDAGNRKRFFEDFAAKKGFNPLDPELWYQHLHEIWFDKRSQTIASYHNRSLARALLDLFPDIGLDKRKLQFQYIWRESSSRRNFFITVAKEKGLDPHQPQTWYSHWRDIRSIKGTKEVAFYNNNSIPQALMDLFSLEKSKFF